MWPITQKRWPIHHQVSWFVIGFLILVVTRSAGIIPHAILAPTATDATLLTVISMATLGRGVDGRIVTRAGGRVPVAVILSLIALSAVSLGLINLIGFA